MSRVCAMAGCSNVFEPAINNPNQMYCSAFCRQKAKRLRYTTTVVNRVCPTCGDVFQTTESALRNNFHNYCSADCAPERHRDACELVCQRCGKGIIGLPQVKWCDSCKVELRRQSNRERARRAYKRPVHTQRACSYCGEMFVPKHGGQIYHSLECAKRAQKNNSKHKERCKKYMMLRNIRSRKPPNSERVYRARIFERDNWTCQLCGKKVDRRLRFPHPKCATLDHIIPLANGGTHVPENCQLAHFICNSRRSNVGEAQLRLFA